MNKRFHFTVIFFHSTLTPKHLHLSTPIRILLVLAQEMQQHSPLCFSRTPKTFPYPHHCDFPLAQPVPSRILVANGKMFVEWMCVGACFRGEMHENVHCESILRIAHNRTALRFSVYSRWPEWMWASNKWLQMSMVPPFCLSTQQFLLSQFGFIFLRILWVFWVPLFSTFVIGISSISWITKYRKMLCSLVTLCWT